MFQIAQPSEVSTQTPEVSKHQGIVSIVFDSGTAFRVWAPFAKKVQVAFYEQENQDSTQQ
ncbi:hypothetical protein [Nostoc sp. CHAB 5715]|uniref:hypothetical protein n=1 Tax=Nostoc sp. CHAB 5715 TaxID=2780400 RepID=UPI001E4F2D6D|nr:hypothetical protein [Nostoc sp. CHAB 5715]MCC5620792.1 hypothetical protein [Nostoc sp. CHAB 5715]